MTPPPAPPGQYGGHHQSPYEGEGDQPLVRPYAMTGGRTRPRYQLAIEALVSTTADPAQYAGLLPEHQRICHLVPRRHELEQQGHGQLRQLDDAEARSGGIE